MNNEIPKIIHYCWFGGKKLSELSIKCIESWKKYFPDYEIKRWDESNFDINICDYVREAYAAKKWAFVSDYARFWILYNEGGVYFDTDVEVIRSFDDIIDCGPFMGCERSLNDSVIRVAPGLGIAARRQMDLYKRLLDYYEKKSFYNENGEIDCTTVVEYTTTILKFYGLKETKNTQTIAGINIYPTDFFCPMNYETGEIIITENTHSIHRYSESWKTELQQYQNKILHKLVKKFGKKNGYKIWRIYTFPYRVQDKIRQRGIWGTIRFACNKLKG